MKKTYDQMSNAEFAALLVEDMFAAQDEQVSEAEEFREFPSGEFNPAFIY